MITRDDAPNCKLARSPSRSAPTTTPNHRALSDARATVDVLHGLMERLGGLGVHTLEELQTFTSRVSPAVRRKRHLAEHLPHSPGVYLFRDERERVLYVGTSRDLRTRVRSYFTASETRSRMGEMVNLAASVTGIECATPLEARVRELRLIAAHKPRYNRRSRHPREDALAQADRRAVAAAVAGPQGGRGRRRLPRPVRLATHGREVPGRAARDVPDPAVQRPAARSRPTRSPCVLAEMGRCLSPCDGSVSTSTTTPPWCAEVRDRLLRRRRRGRRGAHRPDGRLAADERFEEAGVHRDRLSAFVRAASRTQRLGALPACTELVAARREDDRRWAVHVVRHGRLAAAGRDPARRPRRRLGHRAARVRRDGGDRPRPDPGRQRRGVRADPALARAARRPAGRTSTASGPARSAAPPATSRSTTRSSSRGSRWSRSTSAARWPPCTSRCVSGDASRTRASRPVGPP